MRQITGKLLLAAGMSLAMPAHADDMGGALALIGVNTGKDGIEVVGTALAIEAGVFKGEMVIDRKGASGTVSTRQSRDLTLAAGDQADIARVGVSYRTGDQLTVTVKVTRDGVLISEATLSTAEN